MRYLASCAHAAGHETVVVDGTDGGQAVADFAAAIASKRPDVVGFGIQFAAQAKPTQEVAAALRRKLPSCGLLAGGQALNFGWTDLLQDGPSFDAAACFEAEAGLPPFLHWWSGGRKGHPPPGFYVREGETVTFTGFSEPIADLDTIPFPRRDAQSRVYGEPNFVMLTSRGCQSSCTFCSSGFFGNRYHAQARWRARSVENVVCEVSALVEKHGAKAISFADDDFLGGKASVADGRHRAERFAESLGTAKLEIAFSVELRADEVVAGQ